MKRTCLVCAKRTDRCICPDREAPTEHALMSQQEVAVEMGLSRNMVGQIERSALRKLRKALAGAR